MLLKAVNSGQIQPIYIQNQLDIDGESAAKKLVGPIQKEIDKAGLLKNMSYGQRRSLS
jgi:hypothetical protein